MAQDANDWAISRSRFWGTPLPIWASEDGEEVVVVSSKAQLEQLTGARVSAPQPVLPLTPYPTQGASVPEGCAGRLPCPCRVLEQCAF